MTTYSSSARVGLGLDVTAVEGTALKCVPADTGMLFVALITGSETCLARPFKVSSASHALAEGCVDALAMYGSWKIPPRQCPLRPSKLRLAARPRPPESAAPCGELAVLLCGLASNCSTAGRVTTSSSTGDMKPDPGLVRSLTASRLPLRAPASAELHSEGRLGDGPSHGDCSLSSGGTGSCTYGCLMKSLLPMRRAGFLISNDCKKSWPAEETLSAALPSKMLSSFSILASNCMGFAPVNGGLPISNS
mmetsp:Transcript_51929/g.123621  ORF Transcript_51929/g.123621 Transcript_51929/m.123621 type:complete len:249 (-) Transcript_51929:714-1460(-)